MKKVTGKALGVLVLVVSACGISLGLMGIDREAASAGRVEVVGASSFDFGKVRDPSVTLVHRFTLRNGTETIQRIAQVSKSCQCLEADTERDVLSPGESTTIAVSINARAVYGKREARAFVRFEDPDTPVVGLTVSAYVEPIYKVVVDPSNIMIPRTVPAGTERVETLDVSEFVSSLEDSKRESIIESTGARGFELAFVDSWKSHGWRFTGGYVRTTTVTLSYRVPEEWDTANAVQVSLRFRKARGADEREPGPELEAEALLTFYRL